MKLRVDSRAGNTCTTVRAYDTVAGSFWWVTQDASWSVIRLFISPNLAECKPRTNNDEDTSVIVDRIDRQFAACRLEYVTDPDERNEWSRNLLYMAVYPMFPSRSKSGNRGPMYGVHKGWEPKAVECGPNNYMLVEYNDIFDVIREIAAHICTEIADGSIYYD